MAQRGARAQAAILALAERVRERRLSLAISQEELAHRAGLHRTYVSDIERGNRNVAIANLVRFADALEIPVADLFAAGPFRTVGGRDCDE
jgi:transcriptional regulator with XRE-family HTH domain